VRFTILHSLRKLVVAAGQAEHAHTP